VIAETSRPPLEAIAALPDVEEVQAFGERAHARVREAASGDPAAAIRDGLERQGIRVIAAREIAPSLEDVFIELITPNAAAAAGAVRSK
jgi:uncharacterized protein DUF4162